jgi:hypothetical protein
MHVLVAEEKGFVEAGNHPGFFLTREYWSRIPAITGE